jgi:hypothetical protein
MSYVSNGPRRPGIDHLWGWGIPALGSLVTSAGSIFLGFALSLDDSSYHDKGLQLFGWAALGLGGLGCIAVAQYMSLRNRSRETASLQRFNDELGGLYRAFGELARSRKRRQQRDEFFKAAVRQGHALLPLTGARVCVYILDSNDDETGTPYLKLVDFAGRADQPRAEFSPDTVHGKALIDAAIAMEQITVSRRETSPVPLDYSDGSVWRSFFVVPLVDFNHSSRGVLCVDTRERTQFTEVEVAIARNLASLIVIGLGELYDAAVDTQPEVSELLRTLERLRESEAKASSATARTEQIEGQGDHE